VKKTLVTTAMLLACGTAAAGDYEVNFGGVTHHFRNDQEHQDLNYGLGFGYNIDKAVGFDVGFYQNSNYTTTKYALVRYQPFEVKGVRLGFLAGVADGYKPFRNGGWFPAALPAASKSFGPVNVTLVGFPSIGKTADGMVSLQLGYTFGK